MYAIRSYYEDLGAEYVNFSIFCLPGIGGKTSLETGLLEEGLSIPAVLGGHLREKNAVV